MEAKVNGKQMARIPCLKKCTQSNQPESSNWGATRVLQNDKQYRNDGCLPSENKRLSNRARSKLKQSKKMLFLNICS